MLPQSAETDAPEMLIGAGVAASRVIVGNDNLVRVTWVTRSECFRLRNIRKRLGAGNQIYVRGAIRQRRQQSLDKLTECTERGEAEPPCALPQAIIMAPARKFSCLSMPSS
jgi:hypothetical protein